MVGQASSPVVAAVSAISALLIQGETPHKTAGNHDYGNSITWK